MRQLRITIAFDPACYSPEKAATGVLGGTERRLVLLANYLEQNRGHEVFRCVGGPVPPADVVVHSNVFADWAQGDRHVCIAGSWHTDAVSHKYDRVLYVSEFMRRRMGHHVPTASAPREFSRPDATAQVAYPPLEPSVLTVVRNADTVVKGRIVCTANPNRYLSHAVTICSILDERGVNYEWHFCGGNRLYSEQYPECYNDRLPPKLIAHGVLDRAGLYSLLASAHIFAYPNLTDDSETFCVAVQEALALGIRVVVPDREPFHETVRMAFPGRSFAATPVEFAVAIDRELSIDSLKQPACRDATTADKMSKSLEQTARILEEVAEA